MFSMGKGAAIDERRTATRSTLVVRVFRLLNVLGFRLKLRGFGMKRNLQTQSGAVI